MHPALTVQFCTRRDRVILGLPNFIFPTPMQVSRIWQEIADQKDENHGSSIGSNTFLPFYFDVIRHKSVMRRVLLPIGNFPNTCGSVIYRYGNFPNPLPFSYGSLTRIERSYSLHLANGGMERCSCWQRLPTSKFVVLKKIMCT